jgi:hypothetical protein
VATKRKRKGLGKKGDERETAKAGRRGLGGGEEGRREKASCPSLLPQAEVLSDAL